MMPKKITKKILLTSLLLLIIGFVGGFMLISKVNNKTNPQDPTTFKSEKIKDLSIPSVFSMPEITIPTFPNKTCLVTKYGAVGNGKILNTKSINAAINACTENGGGTVVIPTGTWLTGPIVLKSNINLHLEKESTLLFSHNFKDYQIPTLTRYEGIDLYNYSPFIYALNAENIAITGNGKIDGQGEAWADWDDKQGASVTKLYQMGQDKIDLKNRNFAKANEFLRPSFVQFVNSKNILLEDFYITNSPMWTIHPLYSENITIRNVIIDSTGPNTDGVVIDSSKNVSLNNLTITSGDDAIAIKSGKDIDGMTKNIPSENVSITNCTVQEGHSGIAIGSEMSGGIRNISISSSAANRVDYGFHIKSMRGRGGVIENIWLDNFTIGRADSTAIRLDTLYGTPRPQATNDQPLIQKIYISNVTNRRTDEGVYIVGSPEQPIKNIILQNVSMTAKQPVIKENVTGDIFNNVEIKQR